jgi:hypothetical protein
VGEVVYDKEHNILWTHMSSDISGAGAVKIVTAVIFTERGAIQINQYTKEEEADRYLPLFYEIPIKIKLPKELIYRP